MTIDEFLRLLRARASACRWVFTLHAIRTDAALLARQCPLTFVADVPGPHTYDTAGHQLGLSRDQVTQLVRAADAEPGHDPALRQALLEAVGLVEGATP